jgi:predicted ArsR family transcriptional regulator
MLTHETRLESFILTDKPKRRAEILSALTKPMTARQLAYKLGYSDLNAVKPRLTELMRDNKVKAVDKVKDGLTGRTVAVYERID